MDFDNDNFNRDRVPKMSLENFLSGLSDEQESALSEVLDEMVHDAKAYEAAEINNQGATGQLQYLQEALGAKGLHRAVKENKGLVNSGLLEVLTEPED